MVLKFPETCYCISLRTGTTIIGILGVVLSIFYFIMTMTFALRWRMSHDDSDPYFTFYGIAEILSLEYTTSLQIVFNSFLLCGTYSKKSCFVLAWLICQLNIYLTVIIAMLFWFTRYVFHELYVIVLLITGGVMFVVFSYYRTMIKPIAT